MENWDQMWPPNVDSHDHKLGSNVTDAGETWASTKSSEDHD